MKTKALTIKLTKGDYKFGPFNITDQEGNIIAENISLDELILGVSYFVDASVVFVTLTSLSDCGSSITKPVSKLTVAQYNNMTLQNEKQSCLWTHLVDHTIYNSFYGVIKPYVIEYPFAYQYMDEIVQNVQSYDLVYKYFNSSIGDSNTRVVAGASVGVSDRNNKIQTNDFWFNKAVLHDGQMSSGILELEPKPLNDMRASLAYPKYNTESKTIGWTKTDSAYNYNTFWDITIDKNQPLFLTTCENLSIDKVVNQTNMDYNPRSFKKSPLRAKNLKIRHILDDRDDITIVTQFITAPAQISYL